MFSGDTENERGREVIIETYQEAMQRFLSELPGFAKNLATPITISDAILKDVNLTDLDRRILVGIGVPDQLGTGLNFMVEEIKPKNLNGIEFLRLGISENGDEFGLQFSNGAIISFNHDIHDSVEVVFTSVSAMVRQLLSSLQENRNP